MIQDLLEEHIEEIDFLWRRRFQSLHDSVISVRDALHLEVRLLPHIDALFKMRETAIPALVDALDSLQFFDPFAATYCLLRLNHEGIIKRITDDLSQNEDDEIVAAHIKALCHAASAATVRTLAATPALPESVALQLTEAMVFTGATTKEIHQRIKNHLRHKDTVLRRHAWRIARLAPWSIAPEEGLAGVLDEDKDVRRFALETIAWSAQPQLPDHCRRAATKPTADNFLEIQMLATLATAATPEDDAILLALVNNQILGEERFALARTLGRPETIEVLFKGMESSNPREAQAAGHTFARITGCTLRIDRRVPLPPADGHEPDEIEKEFLDEAEIPDIEDAARQWEEIKDRFTPGHRYSGGIDITETPADWSEVDMQSRWEHHLRNAFYGRPHLTPVELEQFPLRLNPDPATAAPVGGNDPRQPPRPRSYLLKQWPRNRTAE
jgi:uncharacterized protein (TIGR02270 family)